MTGPDYALAVAAFVIAAAAILASRRDRRTFEEYQRQVARLAATEDTPDMSRDDRRKVVSGIRHGKPISDPDAATVLLRQYDEIGKPPDYTRSGCGSAMLAAIQIPTVRRLADRHANPS